MVFRLGSQSSVCATRFLSRQLDHLVARLSKQCVLCNARSSFNSLCQGCRRDLPRLPAAHCAVRAIPTATHDICGQCLKAKPAFDAGQAAFVYAVPIDKLGQSLKFGAALSVSRRLGRELLAAIDGRHPPDVILPMPLSRERLRERGLNQAMEIGRAWVPGAHS